MRLQLLMRRMALSRRRKEDLGAPQNNGSSTPGKDRFGTNLLLRVVLVRIIHVLWKGIQVFERNV